MLRSSKNADQRKQWWYRVGGYSAVAPLVNIVVIVVLAIDVQTTVKKLRQAVPIFGAKLWRFQVE